MKVAAKSIRITPPIGLSIGGNVRADDKSRGIHDDLFCNAVFFSKNDTDVLFLSFDLLLLMLDQCHDIKQRVSKATGVPVQNIMVNVTHTHSGPDTGDIFKVERHSDAVEYLDKAFANIAEELTDIRCEAEECDCYFACSCIEDLSFNRRLVMKDETLKMNWMGVNPEDVLRTTGPIDPQLSVFQVVSKASGQVKAMMINFTLHPAILVGKDWLYSRDYIHFLTVDLKKVYGESVTVWFSNGAEGNINHINYKDLNQGRGFEEAARIGQRLAMYIDEAIKDKIKLQSETLKSVMSPAQLPIRKLSEKTVKDAKELWEACGGVYPSLLDGVPDEVYAREIIKLASMNEEFITTELQAVNLCGILIVSFPGEVFVEFGLEVKERSGFKNTVVVGLANDYVGYIPNKAAFSQGGYEIKTAQSSKLSETAGETLVQCVLDLIQRL